MTHPPRPPLRLAAHNGAPGWGGAEVAVSRLLAGLDRRGHDVRFLVAQDAVARPAADFGLDVRPLHVGGDVAVHHALRVRRALREHGSGVLLVGTFRKLLHLAAGARLAGVPVVARIGLTADVPRNVKYRFVVSRWVDRVVVGTEAVREAYLTALPRLDRSRIVLIRKGIEPPVVERGGAALRASLGIPADAVVVTALARLVEDKRLDRFVDVLAGLPSGVVGLVAGDGPLRAELEERARTTGAHVRFLGHVEPVGDLLDASDLLLVTSRREEMANVMLEALALGVPVVSTPVGGTRTALGAMPGETPPGIVTKGFEPAELHAAVESLVADPARRARMAEAARRRARERFAFEPMLDAWEALLNEVARRT